MSSETEEKELLRLIPEAFKDAENAIKRVEMVNESGNLNIPSINELRYAGKHLCSYLSGIDKLENLRKALGHCERAQYDALETESLYLIRMINKFLKETEAYPDIRKEEIPNVSEIRAEVKEYEDIFVKSDFDKRGEHLTNLKARTDKLKTHLTTLGNAAVGIEERVEQANQNQVKADRKWLVGISLKIIGILVTIGFLILGVIEYTLSNSNQE